MGLGGGGSPDFVYCCTCWEAGSSVAAVGNGCSRLVRIDSFDFARDLGMTLVGQEGLVLLFGFGGRIKTLIWQK